MNDGTVVGATIRERKKEDKAARLQIQEFSLRNARCLLCGSNHTDKSWKDANFKFTWSKNRSRGTESAYTVRLSFECNRCTLQLVSRKS